MTDAVESPRAVAAVLLFSANPRALARFYHEKLGVALQWVTVPGVEPHWAGEIAHVYFSIWQGTQDPTPSGSHNNAGVAFFVSDVQAAFDRLVQEGVAVEFAPRRTALGLIARLRDPDGNRFELYQP
jgi:catechol 2,3-dioxygenase-like lactoylglutathione lyase family enzyme